ncbi:mitochondrial fission process protein 1-like [Cimex lectularius]|uniref:Mitochondrial fission process protein 1 n=1 Tax=Cimex lectularius TaxID=79782 RepID=A0A8I6RZ71_CIMLE|nr:mitochondrial fission process protein 1-like [Cimex lectularius]
MLLEAECMGGEPSKKRRKKEKKKDGDLYRDSNLRYAGYSNEIGEALRPFIGRNLVTASYALASAYVIADVGSKSADAWKNTKGKKPDVRRKETFKKGSDALVWQSLASVIVPGFVLNRLAAISRFIICKTPAYQFRTLLTAATSLAVIPFIVEPIDRFVDGFMKDFVRPIYNKK